MVHCTAHCTLHTAHCTLHTAHCTLHTAHCTLHTAHCTLHTAHGTRHTAHGTRHTAHGTALHLAILEVAAGCRRYQRGSEDGGNLCKVVEVVVEAEVLHGVPGHQGGLALPEGPRRVPSLEADPPVDELGELAVEIGQPADGVESRKDIPSPDLAPE